MLILIIQNITKRIAGLGVCIHVSMYVCMCMIVCVWICACDIGNCSDDDHDYYYNIVIIMSYDVGL